MGRFTITHSEFNAGIGQVKIIMDKKTGINYLAVIDEYGQAITPLLGPNGMPVKSVPNPGPKQ